MTIPELRIAPDGRVATRTHRVGGPEWTVVAGPDASWLTQVRPLDAEVETWALLVPAVPPIPDSELRNEVARRFSELDAHDWGGDHGFAATYGTDAETDAFVDAVADMVQQARIELSEARHDLGQLEERVAEQHEINRGWFIYGQRVKAERAELGDKLIDALGLREQRVGRHFERLVPQACEEIARLRSDLDQTRRDWRAAGRLADERWDEIERLRRQLARTIPDALAERLTYALFRMAPGPCRNAPAAPVHALMAPPWKHTWRGMSDNERTEWLDYGRGVLDQLGLATPNDTAGHECQDGWIDDANWEPENQAEQRAGRRPGSGLLECPTCAEATATAGPAPATDVVSPNGPVTNGVIELPGLSHPARPADSEPTGPAPAAGPLGVGVVVRIKRDVNIVPAGTIGLVIGQAANGPYRYTVMFPGDPYPYSVAAKDMDVVRGLDPQAWWKPVATPAAPSEADPSNDEEAVT